MLLHITEQNSSLQFFFFKGKGIYLNSLDKKLNVSMFHAPIKSSISVNIINSRNMMCYKRWNLLSNFLLIVSHLNKDHKNKMIS